MEKFIGAIIAFVLFMILYQFVSFLFEIINMIEEKIRCGRARKKKQKELKELLFLDYGTPLNKEDE